MSIGLWPAIARHISEATEHPFHPDDHRSAGGGCISSAYRLSGQGQTYFVKINQASGESMFAAEASGLNELAKASAIRVPCPICWGTFETSAYLVLEYLDLGPQKSGASTQLGTQLAQLHRYQQDHYGWDRNNTIGSTPQINTWTSDWTLFYREHRLGYQVQLAQRQGYRGHWTHEAHQLMEQLDGFFQSYTPAASLLHGDLWGGNYGVDTEGQPVLFDPAVYYGDRETDLAMTELFGGFSPEFYTAYETAYPLDPGYALRKPLYKLYHLLNHLNLFGGGYLGSVTSTISQCLTSLQRI